MYFGKSEFASLSMTWICDLISLDTSGVTLDRQYSYEDMVVTVRGTNKFLITIAFIYCLFNLDLILNELVFTLGLVIYLIHWRGCMQLLSP